MQYTTDGECLGSFEPNSDDLADGMILELGDEGFGCIAISQE
jgi:hypothetical protein